MAGIVWSNVLDVPGAVADGFGNTTAGWQALVVLVANEQLDPDMFDGENGPITAMARAVLACHYTALALRGVRGFVASQSEGQVSESYAIPPFNRSNLLATAYGMLLLSLLNSSAGGAMVL